MLRGMRRPLPIWMVIFPDAQILDASGPVEVFSLANRLGRERGPRYEVTVVARRPSSSPASPSRNAPLHTEATRRARGAVRRIHETSRASRIAARVPRPPATMRVSTGPVACRMLRPATRGTPLDVATGPASGPSTVTS